MNIRDIIPWSSRDPSLNRPMSLFDEFVEKGIGSWSEFGAFTPVVDVTESESAIEVTAELPGIEEKDIDLTLDARGLTLRGEKKKESTEESNSFYRTERSFGSFQRFIPFSTGIDRDHVKARFKNGVLKIHLPKINQELPQGQRVEIEP